MLIQPVVAQAKGVILILQHLALPHQEGVGRFRVICQSGVHAADDVVAQVALVVSSHIGDLGVTLECLVGRIAGVLIDLVVAGHQLNRRAQRINGKETEHLTTGSVAVVHDDLRLGHARDDVVILFRKNVVVTTSDGSIKLGRSPGLHIQGGGSQLSQVGVQLGQEHDLSAVLLVDLGLVVVHQLLVGGNDPLDLCEIAGRILTAGNQGHLGLQLDPQVLLGVGQAVDLAGFLQQGQQIATQGVGVQLRSQVIDANLHSRLQLSNEGQQMAILRRIRGSQGVDGVLQRLDLGLAVQQLPVLHALGQDLRIGHGVVLHAEQLDLSVERHQGVDLGQARLSRVQHIRQSVDGGAILRFNRRTVHRIQVLDPDNHGVDRRNDALELFRAHARQISIAAVGIHADDRLARLDQRSALGGVLALGSRVAQRGEHTTAIAGRTVSRRGQIIDGVLHVRHFSHQALEAIVRQAIDDCNDFRAAQLVDLCHDLLVGLVIALEPIAQIAKQHVINLRHQPLSLSGLSRRLLSGLLNRLLEIHRCRDLLIVSNNGLFRKYAHRKHRERHDACKQHRNEAFPSSGRHAFFPPCYLEVFM